MSQSVDTVIAVLESKPHWGPELQRQFLQSSVEIRECRTLKDLLGVPQQFPTGLLVVDLDDFIEPLLESFAQSSGHHLPPWPIIGIASPSLTQLEWNLRDAGLAEFFGSPITGEELQQVCCRQLGVTFSRQR